MCAQYDLIAQGTLLARKYGISIPKDLSFDQRVLPHKEAPVMTLDGLKIMKFGLLPHWAKEANLKFATHNARLETIEEKATWRTPFKKNHCLVPITSFIEPIYSHEFAGSMVAFSEKHGELLSAAGIFDSWTNKETGEVIDSFSIITTMPPELILKTGHDRCPLFLKDEAFLDWLNPENGDVQERKEFLLNNQRVIDFSVTKDRAMKPGWEKRKK